MQCSSPRPRRHRRMSRTHRVNSLQASCSGCWLLSEMHGIRLVLRTPTEQVTVALDQHGFLLAIAASMHEDGDVSP